jgi:Tfp pilus assembly protein PilN
MRAVNLIPGEQRQGAGGLSDLTGRSGGAALILLGVVVGLAVMIAMYGSAHHSIASQDGEVAQIKAQTSAVEARAGRLTPYTNFVSMADRRTETVAQLVQARFDWSHALHELGRVLPAGTSLSSLHGTVGAAGTTTGASASAPAATAGATGATPASSTPPGSTPVFTLTGCATGQTVVAQALQRLRLMDGASEVQLQSSTKSSTGGVSGASGGSGATGGCPGSDPAFTTQVTFVGLPAAPATSTSGAAGAATASASSAGSTESVATGDPSK